MRFVLFSILFLLLVMDGKGEDIEVVLYANPPMIILDDDGPPQGIVLDFLRSLEEKGGLKFSYREESFPDAIELIKNGEADMLPSVGFSYDRQRFMKFSKSFLIRNRGILYRRVGIPFFDMEDLEGRSVAVLRDDVHGEAFEELANIYGVFVELVRVDEYADAVELLGEGGVDFAVLNETFASQISLDGSIVSTYKSFNPIAIRIGYALGTPAEVVLMVDEALEAQHRDPESALHRSIAENFARDSEVHIPVYIWAVIIGVLGVAGFIVGVNRILRKIVKERTEQLRVERDRAEAADRAKSHFLGNVSHEIRTPLNGILGFCQLLETSEHLSVPDRESVDAIVESSHRLESVLTAILRYSDMVSESSAVEKDSIELGQLIEEVAEVLCMRFSIVRSRVRVDLSEVKNKVHFTDGNLWYGILENLIGNALKFGNESNVQIRLMEREMKKGMQCLRLEVEDEGPGIPRGDWERIFLPFEQVDNSLSRRYEGVGLGLSLVKANVNLLGGEIDLRDGKKGGLLVVVEIPV